MGTSSPRCLNPNPNSDARVCADPAGAGQRRDRLQPHQAPQPDTEGAVPNPLGAPPQPRTDTSRSTHSPSQEGHPRVLVLVLALVWEGVTPMSVLEGRAVHDRCLYRLPGQLYRRGTVRVLPPAAEFAPGGTACMKQPPRKLCAWLRVGWALPPASARTPRHNMLKLRWPAGAKRPRATGAWGKPGPRQPTGTPVWTPSLQGAVQAAPLRNWSG